MKLTLESLLIIDMIERKGSFAAAAIALDRVPSALTYTIRKLEDELDVLLFDRRGHRATLTTAGRQLVTEGRNLLHAAHHLEQRVKRTATGRETELRLHVSSLIPFDRMIPLIRRFDEEETGTRLRISHGVLSDSWERLIDGHADLIVGAAHEGPEIIRTSGRFQTARMTSIEWIFAVPAGHPLASVEGPLTAEHIRAHRAIAVGDNSTKPTNHTVGLLSGQERLTVPDAAAKLAAQVAGLGIGHLPRFWAQPWLDDGTLVEKVTQNAKPHPDFVLAWRKDEQGKTLKWFIRQMLLPKTIEMLFATRTRD